MGVRVEQDISNILPLKHHCTVAYIPVCIYKLSERFIYSFAFPELVGELWTQS